MDWFSLGFADAWISDCLYCTWGFSGHVEVACTCMASEVHEYVVVCSPVLNAAIDGSETNACMLR